MVSIRSINKKKLIKVAFVGAMTAPAIIGFLVFYVYVNFDSIVMAFQVNDFGKLHFGFNNFSFFFNEISNPYSVFSEAILNTAIFFLLGYVAMLGSFVVAYFIYKKVFGYKFYRFIFYLPCIIMSTATSSLFYYVTRGGGPLDILYQHILGKEMPSLWNNPGSANVMLAVYTLFYGIGGNMVLFLGAMTNISPEIFDAAKIDGVGWFREMVQIVIPLIWSTLSVMILTSITGLTQASGPVFLFTKGKYGTYTINYWLYEQLLAGVNLEISAAVGWCCTAVTFPVALLTRKVLDKIDEKVGV
jgi:ABC-type sugar transport system permease subunit